MIDCALPTLSVATCDYQEFFDNRTQCNGRSMFEGHCPFRKIIEDAPADNGEAAVNSKQHGQPKMPAPCNVDTCNDRDYHKVCRWQSCSSYAQAQSLQA